MSSPSIYPLANSTLSSSSMRDERTHNGDERNEYIEMREEES
jgi:hypothetical protein